MREKSSLTKKRKKIQLATSFIPHIRGKTRRTTANIKGAKKNYVKETTLLENGLPLSQYTSYITHNFA